MSEEQPNEKKRRKAKAENSKADDIVDQEKPKKKKNSEDNQKKKKSKPIKADLSDDEDQQGQNPALQPKTKKNKIIPETQNKLLIENNITGIDFNAVLNDVGDHKDKFGGKQSDMNPKNEFKPHEPRHEDRQGERYKKRVKVKKSTTGTTNKTKEKDFIGDPEIKKQIKKPIEAAPIDIPQEQHQPKPKRSNANPNLEKPKNELGKLKRTQSQIPSQDNIFPMAVPKSKDDSQVDKQNDKKKELNLAQYFQKSLYIAKRIVLKSNNNRLQYLIAPRNYKFREISSRLIGSDVQELPKLSYVADTKKGLVRFDKQRFSECIMPDGFSFIEESSTPNVKIMIEEKNKYQEIEFDKKYKTPEKIKKKNGIKQPANYYGQKLPDDTDLSKIGISCDSTNDQIVFSKGRIFPDVMWKIYLDIEGAGPISINGEWNEEPLKMYDEMIVQKYKINVDDIYYGFSHEDRLFHFPYDRKNDFEHQKYLIPSQIILFAYFNNPNNPKDLIIVPEDMSNLVDFKNRCKTLKAKQATAKLVSADYFSINLPDVDNAFKGRIEENKIAEEKRNEGEEIDFHQAKSKPSSNKNRNIDIEEEEEEKEKIMKFNKINKKRDSNKNRNLNVNSDDDTNENVKDKKNKKHSKRSKSDKNTTKEPSSNVKNFKINYKDKEKIIKLRIDESCCKLYSIISGDDNTQLILYIGGRVIKRNEKLKDLDIDRKKDVIYAKEFHKLEDYYDNSIIK